jgi:hypothetical protein
MWFCLLLDLKLKNGEFWLVTIYSVSNYIVYFQYTEVDFTEKEKWEEMKKGNSYFKLQLWFQQYGGLFILVSH